MTDFELLRLIGEAEDKYVMESRKRPKKTRPQWAYAVAACLMLVILTGTGVMFFRDGGMFGTKSAAMENAAEDSAAAGAAPEEAPEAPAEAPEAAPEEDMTAYDVTLLAGAEYPAAVGAEDYEGASQRWQENQTSDTTKTAMNAFAYSTAAAVLRDREESGCYSPLSLYQTLSILASGAEGQTKDELLSLLGQGDVETLAAESGKLYRVNYADNEVNRLKIANSLWLDKTASDGMPVEYKQDWVMSAAADYYADVYEAEFSGEDTPLAMGQWIAQNTGGLLKPSPEELSLSPDTVMAIVNTLWYKTQWGEKFLEEDTAPADFSTESGETVNVDFMHRTDVGGRFIQTEEYTKSKLRLDRGSMIVALPREGVDVDSLLTEEKLWEIFENGDYQEGDVIWSVPKFETIVTYPDLKETLRSLGVTSAFELGAADFSKISDTPLFVGKIQQGAHIAVNEDGVEAAAYSMATEEAGEAMPEELPTVEMNLNRPFIYLITANDGSTLFMGVVRHPTQ